MHLRHDISRFRLVFSLVFCSVLFDGCTSLPKTPLPGKNLPPVTSVTPSTASGAPGAGNQKPAPVMPAAGSGRGGYYLDDGPGDKTPEGLLNIPDAEPKIEPLFSRGNKPYVVFGKTYTPISDNQPFKQRGIGSWYGKKFHGQKTSSGELYDMYKMTAAHPTLPLPSYVRVTNVSNGAKAIVRINDRGPFHSSRIIDLSYTAAYKLGYLGKGSSELEIERILPEEVERIGRYKATVSPVPAQATQLAQSSVTPANTTSAVLPAAPPATPVTGMETPEVFAVTPPQTVTSVPEPAVTSMPATVITAAPQAAPTRGFYLQFGAFARADNAEEAGNRLRPTWPSTLPALKVVEFASLHRLYSGPFASREEAASAAQSAQDADLPKPLVVERKD